MAEVELDLSRVDEIVKRYGGGREDILAILQDVQAEYNYLPREAMTRVSELTGVPMTQIATLATFFHAFALNPRGRHIVTVCMGTACHVRGAPLVLEELERELGIKNGETTEDMMFTIETVNCVGACALGPLVIVDGKYHGNVKVSEVEKLLAQYKEEA